MGMYDTTIERDLADIAGAVDNLKPETVGKEKEAVKSQIQVLAKKFRTMVHDKIGFLR